MALEEEHDEPTKPRTKRMLALLTICEELASWYERRASADPQESLSTLKGISDELDRLTDRSDKAEQEQQDEGNTQGYEQH